MASIDELRAAAQQAVEAWQTSSYGQPSHQKAMVLAMTALRGALADRQHNPGCALLQIPARECDCGAEPVQEPVAPDASSGDDRTSLGVHWLGGVPYTLTDRGNT